MKTTKERVDQNIHDETVNHLQDLLVKNYDAEKGFKQSMEKVENQPLKNFMQKQAAQHSRFANEITKELRNLNEEPRDTSSLTGDMHRTWVDIKTAFTSDSNKDETVLAECLKGEKASFEEYEEKMKNHHFPNQISNVLHRQANEIHQTVNQVKRLEDLAKIS